MKIFLIPVFFSLLYLFFIIPTINAPITYDELHWPVAAQSLNETGKPLDFFGREGNWSPAFYVNIQAIFYRIFDVSNYSSRLIGVCCVFIQLLIFFLFGRVLFDNLQDRRSFLFISSALFITNPATIQGSLIPSNDTTLLPLFFSLFALFFIRFEKERNLKNIIILGVIFSLALWSKLSTPFGIIVAMILYYLIKKDPKGIFWSFFVCGTGIFIFLVTWKWYCIARGVEFFGPIKYIISSFLNKQLPETFDSRFIGLAIGVVRFILWIGSYSLLLLFLICSKKIGDFRKKRIVEPIAFLILFTVLLVIGYFFIGGVGFGFPRYHYPILPAISIICAFALKDILAGISKKDFFVYGVSIALLFLFYYFIVQDLLYIFNFSLREAVVTFPPHVKSVLTYFGYKFALYILPSAAVFMILGIYKKTYRLFKKIIISLLIMIFATNLSLDFIQSKADYLVRFCYGEKGTEELIEYLNENTVLGDIVLATEDIIYYLKDKKMPYFAGGFWYNTDKMVETIKQPSVKFVVYSIGHNDIKQFRTVFSHPAFTYELHNNFIFRKIGSYTLWIKTDRNDSGNL